VTDVHPIISTEHQCDNRGGLNGKTRDCITICVACSPGSTLARVSDLEGSVVGIGDIPMVCVPAEVLNQGRGQRPAIGCTINLSRHEVLFSKVIDS
jgi:hypothetical protein